MENPLRTLLDDIRTGHRVNEDEALDLFHVPESTGLGDCDSCR